MSRRTLEQPVQHLLSALEAERSRSDPRVALDAVIERLRPGFSRWIGSDGWDALATRARADAATSPRAEDEDAKIITSIADILTRLLGASLALQLIEQACEAPDPRPGRRSHHG